ncbi:TlpA disulfide reductase family protein [Permianibacter aggregans]|uniref:Peroxiredoxin n=1 Tax=Permianibacter aggregans TaxID=1510150 RepID=A0A4R6UXZ6_9GAMM|nr:TlpA disulfide reductase family protein [Permianibacter aggregans]QGX38664.1 TlpA family protein disulfide reductase [Permianibacter aggregans]TDQ50455.1 peroxiredoxin [Permianibacter aggregans]
MSNRRAVIATSLLMLLFVSGLVVSSVQAKELSGPAKDFTLKVRGGGNTRLADLRGEVVMINFWASWCGPCRQEMPLLEDMYQRYKDLGFTILGVNVDHDPALADKLLKDIKVSFPVLLDAKNEISRLYDIDAMPSTVMVDRNGNMRFLHRGYKPGYEVQYEEQIKQLVRE